MNSMMAIPMELQYHLHQQMLFHQQQVSLRRRELSENRTNSNWTIPPAPGGGPPLPPEVKVELQNRELWKQFHEETTEMIITKSGRLMFPSIQLAISGLECRARYCVLLEVEPASDRRHKYVGGGGGGVAGFENGCGNARGWTSAGPAELQPSIDRRLYLHPESPATGAHWMQHSLKFNKLKLTNNAADPKTNIVLTSMHKYIPRIWIIRCDNVTRLSDLYAHPASSFKFSETEFIAVTAYQNENITKLKINNNPFAKGFRETGRSRCKRKFQHVETDDPIEIVDEEENVSFESESTRIDHLEVATQRPKTASSETGSLDDSGVSSCGNISPPLSTMNQRNPLSKDADRDTRPRLHRPWIDSEPQFSSTPSLKLSPRHEDSLDISAHYLRLLHPAFTAQQNLITWQYQSLQ
ncbi:T-box protein 2 [Nomia melanderi]|uniref:T-box protein 2 n=1 Tax=Nomia melanderi TaxID=2448451 RepID=UPI0013043E87|nr:T-box protein 2-like [Nomia melanderi]